MVMMSTMISTSIVQTILGVRLSLDKKTTNPLLVRQIGLLSYLFLLSSGLPQSEEDIDPVEKNIWKLSTESEVLQEEWDEGRLHVGVRLSQFVMNKILNIILRHIYLIPMVSNY